MDLNELITTYCSMSVPFPDIWFKTEKGSKAQRRQRMAQASDVAQQHASKYAAAMEPYMVSQLRPFGDDGDVALSRPSAVLYIIDDGHRAFINGPDSPWSPTERFEWTVEQRSAAQLVEWYLIRSLIIAVFSVAGVYPKGDSASRIVDPERMAIPYANAAVLMLERGDDPTSAGIGADALQVHLG